MRTELAAQRTAAPADPRTDPPLLAVEDLRVRFGDVSAVSGVSFQVAAGEIVGLVGESGAGKSITARAVIGLLPGYAEVSGSIRYRGEQLLGLPARRLRHIRGGEIGFVFQDALTALDPVYPIGTQMMEALRAHRPMSRRQARQRAAELLDEVQIRDPVRCLTAYPHQLSGGMRQRVMIAISLIADPSLIIADEPTSALDVTVQHRVLGLLSDICESRGTAVLLITHDLGVVAQLCDRVLVLYGGIVVEESDVVSLFAKPRHPYTQALLRILPRLGNRGEPVPIPGSVTPVLGELDHCPFHLRCERAIAVCHTELPVQTGSAAARVRCHLATAQQSGQSEGPSR